MSGRWTSTARPSSTATCRTETSPSSIRPDPCRRSFCPRSSPGSPTSGHSGRWKSFSACSSCSPPPSSCATHASASSSSASGSSPCCPLCWEQWSSSASTSGRLSSCRSPCCRSNEGGARSRPACSGSRLRRSSTGSRSSLRSSRSWIVRATDVAYGEQARFSSRPCVLVTRAVGGAGSGWCRLQPAAPVRPPAPDRERRRVPAPPRRRSERRVRLGLVEPDRSRADGDRRRFDDPGARSARRRVGAGLEAPA